MIEEECAPIKLQAVVYNKIENKVVSLYKSLRIQKTPIDPFKIASQLGYIVEKYSNLAVDFQNEQKFKDREGLSLYNPNLSAFMIFYDDSFSLVRTRFTIMHEIGHILLGHKEESVLANKMANYFAAYSLAPSPLIGIFHCEDFVDVMNRFNVSSECADNCFKRFENWSYYSGFPKQYEKDLQELFLNSENNKE